MSLHLILKVLFHLSPLLPLVFGKIYLAIAGLGLVSLFYIKCFKFTKQIEHLETRGPHVIDEILVLKNLRRKWRYLTFLS